LESAAEALESGLESKCGTDDTSEHHRPEHHQERHSVSYCVAKWGIENGRGIETPDDKREEAEPVGHHVADPGGQLVAEQGADRAADDDSQDVQQGAKTRHVVSLRRRQSSEEVATMSEVRLRIRWLAATGERSRRPNREGRSAARRPKEP